MNSRSKLENLRFRLVQQILTRPGPSGHPPTTDPNGGFQHYLNIILRLKERIKQVLSVEGEDAVLNDDYWDDYPDFGPIPWWKQESPWMEDSGARGIIGALLKQIPQQYLDKLSHKDTMTPQVNLFMKVLIRNYYQNNTMLWPIMINIDLTHQSQQVELHSTATSNIPGVGWLIRKMTEGGFGYLVAALSGSGPFILKMLQQYNNDNDQDLVAGITTQQLTKNIFDNVPALTKRERKYILEHLNIDQFYKDNDLMREGISLGSASLADVYLTREPGFSDPVVMKFLKPMYIYYFICECNFFLNTIWRELRQPGTSDILVCQTRRLLLFLISTFTEEFDYQMEARFTVDGYDVYERPELGVHSIQLITSAVNPSPVLIVTEAPGKSLNKMLKSYANNPEVLKRIYSSLIAFFELWFTNIFWGNGFLHTDLHAGNIFISDQSFEVTVIDYGSSAFLTDRERKLLLDVMLVNATFDTTFVDLIDRKDNLEVIRDDEGDGSFVYFFRQRSPRQEAKLLSLANNWRLRRSHEENLKASLKFTKLILQVCDVPTGDNTGETKRCDVTLTDEEVEKLSRKIINYSNKDFNLFGVLFLGIIEYARNIGQCTNNSTFLFGKGIAYISSALNDAYKACGPQVCKQFEIAPVITAALWEHNKAKLARLVPTVLGQKMLRYSQKDDRDRTE